MNLFAKIIIFFYSYVDQIFARVLKVLLYALQVTINFCFVNATLHQF